MLYTEQTKYEARQIILAVLDDTGGEYFTGGLGLQSGLIVEKQSAIEEVWGVSTT
jgi:hypothetical protein